VRRGIAAVGCQKGQGIITLVIRQPLVDEMPILKKMMHRQEFDGRDAQFGQKVDHRLGR
jgi:hypothetical protein